LPMDFLAHLNEKHFWFGLRPCRECGVEKTSDKYCRGGGMVCFACRAKARYSVKKSSHEYMSRRRAIRNKCASGRKDKQAEACRKWNESNRQRKAYMRTAWKLANPAKCKTYAKARTSKPMVDSPGVVAKIKCEKCYWCGCKLKGDYHLDHVVPLSKGGANAAYNLVASCVKCNLRKSAKMPNQFIGTGQLVLEMM